MSNPNMEAKVRELMELKRMKEELEAEIAAAEDEIKAVMGQEEILLGLGETVQFVQHQNLDTRKLAAKLLYASFRSAKA